MQRQLDLMPDLPQIIGQLVQGSGSNNNNRPFHAKGTHCLHPVAQGKGISFSKQRKAAFCQGSQQTLIGQQVIGIMDQSQGVDIGWEVDQDLIYHEHKKKAEYYSFDPFS
jgi:hypothetical protein